jgi:hypothetical protein
MEGLTKAALFVACVLGMSAAHAGGEVHWYAQIDNDVAFHTDRWYTSGVRIARVSKFDEGKYAEFGILQEVYTPDPHRVASGTIDRPMPHACSSPRRATISCRVSTARSSLIWAFAVPARRASRQPSSSIASSRHRTSTGRASLPNELDIQAVAAQTHDFGRARVHYGAVLGNQVTFVHAGGELRTGGTPASAAQPLRFAATPPLPAGGEPGWQAFAGASARWVARNELLSVNANAIGPPIEREDLVVRIAAGIEWAARWGALTFMLVQDSREFETQHSPHRFGVLALRVDF